MSSLEQDDSVPADPDPRDNERGSMATEYSVLMAFMITLVIVGVTAFGLALSEHYDYLNATLKTALGLP
nr:Flp family type IVb pilin [Arthrobacter celericrescens]